MASSFLAAVACLTPGVPKLGHALLAVLCAVILGKVVALAKAKIRANKFQTFANSNGCAPAPTIPRPFMGAVRHKVGLLLYSGGDLLDNVFARKFEVHGTTHTLCDEFGTPKVVHTIDPVNLSAVLSKSAGDWAPSKSRANTMYPLAQEGLLNSEGESWHRNRKLIMRHIGTKKARDVRNSEGDIQLLLSAIGPCNHDGWTQTVDLLDLLHRISLDMSTTFLLGTSANAQLAGLHDAKKRAAMEEFDLVPAKRNAEMTYGEAYETVRDFFSWRSKLGSKYWMADGTKYRKACKTLNNFADELIERAVERSKSSPDGAQEATDNRYGLIDSLVRDIGDPLHIRNLVMDLFIAGQNMTGTMAAWVFAQLEAHSEIYDAVRNEVLEVFGSGDQPLAPLTWDSFRSCTKMQNVILETLRMYPLLANIGRNAKKDTVLPRGGGPDGQQPIALPKGAAITCNVYLVHRRTEEWGDDAWDFKPDRWIERKIKGGDYAPFGMGPRVCPGQQLTMTEISFLMTRIMQQFEGIRAPEGQDNLTKGYRVVVAPKNGVRVQFKRATTVTLSTMLGAQSSEAVPDIM